MTLAPESEARPVPEGYVRLTEHAPLPISGCEVLTRRQSFIDM